MPPDRAVAKRQAEDERLRSQMQAAHSAPRVHLRTEPWIPVHARGGAAVELGLRDVLLRAHELADLAEPNPLTRAALRRYLTAIATVLVRRSAAGHELWEERLRDNRGFAPEQVEAVLADLDEHLWLYHPVTPFLQDRRLIAAMLSPKLMSAAELVAHLPGETETAWFTKRTDPDATAGLTTAEAARALVTRWFYTINGNSADVTTSAGKVSAQAGSAFSEGPAAITHVFRVSGTSLFATLLRNLTADLVEATDGTTTADGPAWADPSGPVVSGDPLYRYTLTATAALLGPPADGDRVVTVLRGPIPRPAHEVKQLRDSARDADPHRILITRAGAGGAKALRLFADDHRVHNLNQLRRAVLPHATRSLHHGVAGEDRLWLHVSRSSRHGETLELLLAMKQGAASAPKWSQTATVALPALILDPDLAELDGILQACFDQRTGIKDRLTFAVSCALGRRDQDGKPAPARASDLPAKAAVEVAKRAWLDVADAVVEQVRAGEVTEAEARDRLWQAAHDALRTATAPYAGTVRYAASIIVAERELRRKAA